MRSSRVGIVFSSSTTYRRGGYRTSLIFPGIRRSSSLVPALRTQSFSIASRPRPKIIVHLAAAVGVKLIVEHPVHTIETNVIGTEAVLESALKYQCRTLVASTSEVYGKGSRIPFGEDDDVLLGSTAKSRSALAASKMVDEFLGLAYYREYGLPVVPFRLFNTVGPRQTGHYGMVIPRFTRAALRGEPIQVYGDGTQTRCSVMSPTSLEPS